MTRSHPVLVLATLVGMAVSLCAFFAAIRDFVRPPRLVTYMTVMENGAKLEAKDRFPEAIAEFRHALTLMQTVSPDLRTKAAIAAHMRIGVCYREMGEYERALHEWRLALKLGDRKYAQKAIDKLLKRMKGNKQERRTSPKERGP